MNSFKSFLLYLVVSYEVKTDAVAQILVLIERFLLNQQVPVDLRFLTDILALLTPNVVPVFALAIPDTPVPAMLLLAPKTPVVVPVVALANPDAPVPAVLSL